MGKKADEILGRCDVCGQQVRTGDDVANLMVEAGLMPLSDLIHSPFRHIACSPSRLQYFPNQPRDTRPGAKYHPELEKQLRDAHNRLNAE